MTLSLVSHFINEVIAIEGGVRFAVNYGLNRVRFPSPVRAGSKIRAKVVLQSVKEVERGYETIFAVTVEAEGTEKPCCVAESLIRYYR